MTITMDQAVRTVHKPTRSTCLSCHALAGGGDARKRGDLALASGTTADKNYDVHMATKGKNMSCQACHKTEDHLIPGKGSDLRPSEGKYVVACTNCHGQNGPHGTTQIGRHTARVACQSCHIPVYAKNAADTAATEATEIHRDWRNVEWDAAKNRYEVVVTSANNLKPAYRFFNGTSWGNNMKDAAVFDVEANAFAISRPVGDINDPKSKLYPFKYKTAVQPYATNLNMLIALDTANYWKNGNPDQAVKAGLVNMGYSANEPYAWATADEYQMLNHQVSPDSQALTCNSCHTASATQMNLKSLGYTLKDSAQKVCAECHSFKSPTSKNYADMHNKHVNDKKYDCSWCHSFSRPERNLVKPR